MITAALGDASVPLPVVIIALVVGLGALALLPRARAWGELAASTLNQVGWLSLALAVVLLVYAFLPDNKATGTILGFQVGGGIAAILVIWQLGVRRNRRAMDVDTLTRERDDALAQAGRLRIRLNGAAGPAAARKLAPGRHRYKINGSRRELVVVTGNLRDATDCADVWVSSENTRLEIARTHEGSISGIIRYLGAAKIDGAPAGPDDPIATELAAAAERLGPPVAPGTVIATGSGALADTHRCKRIFHVAAADGEPAAGYRPVQDLGNCVTSCLRLADSADEQQHELRSIIFPLLASGQAGGDPEQIAPVLLEAALTYLDHNRGSKIKHVCFLAWTDLDLARYQDLLEADERVTKVG